MKKTMLEFNEDLNSFYTTLKESIILYFITIALLTGSAFSIGIVETVYISLAILSSCVYTVYMGVTFIKFLFLSENIEVCVNYFGDLLIQTFVKDCEFVEKKIVKLFKK
jgi:hypothetical protein